MKKQIKLLLTVACAAWLGSARVDAELFQTIHVNVMSETKAEVQRVPVSLADLPAAIKSHVAGSDRIRVALVIWLPTTKAQQKKIMDLCRAAGATSFTIAFKS
jgi:hypothetical protein